MSSPSGKPLSDDIEQQADGIDMRAVCRTLARVLVWLDKTEYTEAMNQQVVVVEHNDSPDPASETAPARLSE